MHVLDVSTATVEMGQEITAKLTEQEVSVGRKIREKILEVLLVDHRDNDAG